MPKILFIKSDDKHKRVQLGIQDETDGNLTLSVKRSTYETLTSSKVGSEIDPYELTELVLEDEIYKCFNRALRILSASDKSRYELTARLVTFGYSRAAIDGAMALVDEYGYIDEARQLERLVEREANQRLRGKYYILRKLSAKGYKRQLIDTAIRTLAERGDVDFDTNFRLLTEKKAVTDEDGLTALMYKYGYRI